MCGVGRGERKTPQVNTHTPEHVKTLSTYMGEKITCIILKEFIIKDLVVLPAGTLYVRSYMIYT
jgi:hypothetical protein